MITIGYDFHGWPVKAMTLREVLEGLGFTKDGDGGYTLSGDVPILDAYPRLLSDDGMGYAGREEFVINAASTLHDAKIEGQDIRVFNVFKDITTEVRKKEEEWEAWTKAVDSVPYPERHITTRENVKELGLLLRKACHEYIEGHGLADINDVEFHLRDILDKDSEKVDINMEGSQRIDEQTRRNYDLGHHIITGRMLD